ncbi:protoporphyrin IX magnesium chelatase, subunit H, partial [Baffinella frigidus]
MSRKETRHSSALTLETSLWQGGGFFTTSNPEDRRIIPENVNGRKKFKVVYVVLESQYQSWGRGTCIPGNRVSCSIAPVGYLLEELRNPATLKAFQADIETANVFIGSLIFVQELAEKVVEVVTPLRDKLDAVLIFPSMPDVMRLNKVGSFTMAQLGQSQSVIGEFMKKKKQENGASFEGSMLKLLRTLPKVLKYLPSDKAQDARSFMLSFQYWLGGSPENLEALLLMMADKYVYEGQNQITDKIAEPTLLPDIGIWHPLAPKVFENTVEYNNWFDNTHAKLLGINPATAPTIGLILQKSHINTKDEAHYTSLIQELEARGSRVICLYSGGLDFSGPVRDFFTKGAVVPDSVINLTGFALVGGPASQDHDKAVEVLAELNRPYICAVPLVFQSFEDPNPPPSGLQVALQVSLPEIDGAIEPVIYGGRDGVTGRTVPLPDRINLLADRALKWANLRIKKNKDKKLAISIFSFPPDKGNVGTAAYLDVFSSIAAVGKELRRQGYSLGDMPTEPEEIMDMVLNDKEARVGSPYLNVEHKMSVEEYQKMTPYAKELEENWGKPPGQLNSDGQNLLIYGKKFGNIFVGVQPSFGYEGDPMRLLFSKATPCASSPPSDRAQTHTLIPKPAPLGGPDPVGMSGSCYPDRLINSMPNLYYYAANNPSEATIAKRRSYAATISYLTPPAENAGLYKGLKELGDLVGSYQGLRENEARGPSIVNSIVAAARSCNLDKDILDLPQLEDDAKALTQDRRDMVVGAVYRRLMEIESRLLPCGLHTVGVPPTAEESIATLASIASIDRPEDGIESLPRILARSMGREIEEVYRNNNNNVLADVEFNRQITLAVRDATRALVSRSTNSNGRVEAVSPAAGMFDKMSGGTPWRKVLKGYGFDVADQDLETIFNYLEDGLGRIVADNELGALVNALDGKFILPGPGGDPIRNPDVLPTGKNMHALDPQSIPTSAAVDCAKVVVDRLVERLVSDAVPSPWFQVMWMVGVKPVPDSLGRVNKLELISLEELGRPRIDVVVSCSGVFRDLFINQMNLLDRAVKMAAEADEPLEMNFIRKHAKDQAEEMGISLRDAATRIFSNAAGSYSANVGLAIENGGWEGEQQLQEQFISRKGFAFNADQPGMMKAAGDIFKSSLSKVDATFQNLDSSEISLTDVSHYFDSDPTKVVKGLRTDGKKPLSMIADTTTANAQV